MYQNMSCVILGYQLLNYVVSYKVYNSAGEQILDPKTLVSGGTVYGIVVPYGGYFEVTLDDSHKITFKTFSGSVTLLTAQENVTTKICVVRDYSAIINEITRVNGVETYTELHP